jgi:hypothetical protein
MVRIAGVPVPDDIRNGLFQAKIHRELRVRGNPMPQCQALDPWMKMRQFEHPASQIQTLTGCVVAVPSHEARWSFRQSWRGLL